MPDIKNEATRGALCERVKTQMPTRGEVSCDYVLPDYMGDVKKLLKFTACAAPCNKFVGGNEVSFLSVITYRVMYLDRDDVLSEATFTSEYEYNESINDSFIDADCTVRVANLSIRLQGPRKICAKAVLNVSLTITEEFEIPSADLPENAQTERASVIIHSAEFIGRAEREYAEEIGRLSGVPCESVEIIKCNATACVEGYEAAESGISVRGSVYTAALLRTPDGVIRIEKSIPFENTVGSDYMEHSGEKYMSDCFVTDMNVSVNNVVTDNGSVDFYSAVVASYTVECSLRADRNTEYDVTSDAFVVGRCTDCEFENFEYSELLGNKADRRKISFEILRDGTPLRELLDFDTELRGISQSAQNDSVNLSATISLLAVFSTDSEEGCTTLKYEHQIEDTIKFPNVTPDCFVYGNLTLCDISITYDAQKIYVSATLLSELQAECKKVIRVLKSADWSKSLNQDNATVRIYYPEEGETLWSVAKSHGVSISSLMKYNPEAATDAKSPIAAKRLIIVNN